MVVATHHHDDHISGFDLKLWEQGRGRRTGVRRDRGDRQSRRGQDSAQPEPVGQGTLAPLRVQRELDRPLAFNSLSLSNDGLEAQLRSGFWVRHAYGICPNRRRVSTFITDALPRVSVHALGPSHDPDVIALMDPPAGNFSPMNRRRQGRRLAAASKPQQRTGLLGREFSFRDLFAPAYRLDTAGYTARFPELAEHASTAEIDERSQFDMFGAAASLEDAINGTSLVFALDFGKACVLLAGDAEWGTWSAILDDPASREVLSRTRAYKVSHHGSFNGTPSPFVDELLPHDATSLVSLGKMDIWPSIPRVSLLDALEGAQRRLVRTDKLPAQGPDVEVKDDLWVELSIPVG